MKPDGRTWITASGVVLMCLSLALWLLNMIGIVAGVTSSSEIVLGGLGLGLFLTGIILTVKYANRQLADLDRRILIETNQSTEQKYNDAIRDATHRIWICQTWFPKTAAEATQIMAAKCKERRILFASFKNEWPKKDESRKKDESQEKPHISHVWARIQGRVDVETVSDAMHNVAACVRVLHFVDPKIDLKFNYGWHPGWIAIIDNNVFWGPTPVDVDNHSMPLLWHRATCASDWGVFWMKQFELLWNDYSHKFGEELEFNPKLRPPPSP